MFGSNFSTTARVPQKACYRVMPTRPPGPPELWNQQRGRSPVRDLRQRRTHYPQNELYDTAAREKRIPRERWTTGEEPRLDRVHVDIYVWGRHFGGFPDGHEIDLDGFVTLDDEGTNAVRDRDREDTYRSQRGFDICDGNNKFIRRRMLEWLRTKPAALLSLADKTMKAMQAAKKRAKVKRGNVAVPVAKVGVGCRQGRHRSTVLANEAAGLARSVGATVTVRYCHLFKGSIPTEGRRRGQPDTRGPCGCHLGLYMCQNIAGKSLDFYRNRERDERYAEAESAEVRQAILGPIQEDLRLQRFSALVSDQSEHDISGADLKTMWAQAAVDRDRVAAQSISSASSSGVSPPYPPVTVHPGEITARFALEKAMAHGYELSAASCPAMGESSGRAVAVHTADLRAGSGGSHPTVDHSQGLPRGRSRAGNQITGGHAFTWSRYIDDCEGCWWLCETNGMWFLESSAQWTRYMYPNTGIQYWWRDDAHWFWINGCQGEPGCSCKFMSTPKK